MVGLGVSAAGVALVMLVVGISELAERDRGLQVEVLRLVGRGAVMRALAVVLCSVSALNEGAPGAPLVAVCLLACLVVARFSEDRARASLRTRVSLTAAGRPSATQRGS